MNHRSRRTGLLIGVVGALLAPAAILAAPDSTAGVVFGRPDTGSPHNDPPEVIHDGSLTAVDRLTPGTVAISAGGSVDYSVRGFHQVAVYDAGTTPSDISIEGPFPFVNDPDDRLDLGAPTVDRTVTFPNPGRYLVICNITPHFQDAKMYGWVIVK